MGRKIGRRRERERERQDTSAHMSDMEPPQRMSATSRPSVVYRSRSESLIRTSRSPSKYEIRRSTDDLDEGGSRRPSMTVNRSELIGGDRSSVPRSETSVVGYMTPGPVQSLPLPPPPPHSRHPSLCPTPVPSIANYPGVMGHQVGHTPTLSEYLAHGLVPVTGTGTEANSRLPSQSPGQSPGTEKMTTGRECSSGVYGWRRRFIYFTLILLVILVLLNMALMYWILRHLDVSFVSYVLLPISQSFIILSRNQVIY